MAAIPWRGSPLPWPILLLLLLRLVCRWRGAIPSVWLLLLLLLVLREGTIGWGLRRVGLLRRKVAVGALGSKGSSICIACASCT